MNREEHAMLQFNTWSGFYDILLKIPFYISNRTIAQAIHLQDGMSILDVGCGTGILISQLNAKQKKVEFYGVDISPKMVAVAKKKFIEESNVHIIEASSSSYLSKMIHLTMLSVQPLYIITLILLAQ